MKERERGHYSSASRDGVSFLRSARDRAESFPSVIQIDIISRHNGNVPELRLAVLGYQILQIVFGLGRIFQRGKFSLLEICHLRLGRDDINRRERAFGNQASVVLELRARVPFGVALRESGHILNFATQRSILSYGAFV